ncbi:Site-specific DNA recombinase [Formosa sp. Hel1_31_208]|uniref:recombinase family protein n=1 Tax=Formosa sp. Hel1_31_208 TaxID=1798225 RepID=UPI00087B1B7F|nr:recombinase family protein [Formosa sp. Hel1_31_208]SDS49593.1 Site-specific DNA recombinase [Formosa sp. Hel1_31_208]
MLAIYTRLSREDEDSNSIKNQLNEGILFAKAKGFTEYQIYNEGEGVSGGLQIDERPELKKLIDDIVSGKITAVWFRNQNRLERNSFTFHTFVKVIKTAKIDVYFGDKLNDYNDANTFLQSSIISALNQYNKELQGQQTKKVLKQRAIEGKAHGIMAYGYTKDEHGYLVIDEEESKVVKRIYKMSLEGIGTNKIAELLNKDDIPTRYKSKYKGTYKVKHKFNGTKKVKEKSNVTWKGGTIRNILLNTIYYGKRNFSGDLYDVPNIISEAYWQKVNNNLKNNRNNSGQSVKHNYLLRGKIICGKCESNYYGRTRVNKKDNYYMCSSKRYKDKNCGNRSINIDVIEDFIWQRFFADEVLKDKIIEHFSNTNAEEDIKGIQADLKALEKELIKNSERQRKAVSLVLDGVLTNDAVKYELDKLKKEASAIKINIENRKEHISSLENIEVISSNMITELDEVKKKTSFDEKKILIDKYIDKIEINTHRIDKTKGYFTLLIYYKQILEGCEGYYLDFPRYDYAIEMYNEIIVPLSDEYKSKSKDELDMIVMQVYSQMGRTKVITSYDEETDTEQYYWESEEKGITEYYRKNEDDKD